MTAMPPRRVCVTSRRSPSVPPDRLRGELTGSRSLATPRPGGDSPLRPETAASVPPFAARGRAAIRRPSLYQRGLLPPARSFAGDGSGRGTARAAHARVPRPRGCGGIGRHAVFRWPWATPVEVRVLSAASPRASVRGVQALATLAHEFGPVPLSSRGLGRRPLTAETGVRIPVAVLTEASHSRGFRRLGSRRRSRPCVSDNHAVMQFGAPPPRVRTEPFRRNSPIAQSKLAQGPRPVHAGSFRRALDGGRSDAGAPKPAAHARKDFPPGCGLRTRRTSPMFKRSTLVC